MLFWSMEACFGRRVRTIIQVIRSDGGGITGKPTNGHHLAVKGFVPRFSLTSFVEVIGLLTVINHSEWKYLPSLGTHLNHKTTNNSVSLQMASSNTYSSELQQRAYLLRI